MKNINFIFNGKLVELEVLLWIIGIRALLRLLR